jgi:predicted O-linked N-acetylglucosamine transferase (SPINDLY family)
LDSLAYNAHSTAVELLWSGVPLVSAPGRKMAARVGASLLLGSGGALPRALVARGGGDMAALALALLRPGGGGALARAGAALRAARTARAGLFDVETWTAGWEQALAALWDAHAAFGGAGGGRERFHIVAAGGGGA